MAPHKISQLSQQLKNPRSALVLVALGLVVIAIVIATKSGPTHNGDQPTTSTASFIYAKSQPIAPSVTGHGIVRAATNHKAIAEVSGRLVEISELLQPGVFVEAGALLAAIDATDYQLALEQAKANQVSSESTLSELAQRQSTLEATLDLVSENLRITQKELKRKTDLLKRGAISQSLVDSERRNVILQQQEKVNLERDLAILPSQIAMAQAQLDSSLATIELQQRNIERTRFHMPFNGRIAAIDAEQDQFVSAGHLLFTANSIERAEINVQFSLTRLRPFLEVASRSNLDDKAFMRRIVDRDISAKDMRKMVQQFGMQGLVHHPLFPDASWVAMPISLGENLNPENHTLNLLVAVDKPYDNVQPGIKPPLLSGLQVTVTVHANPINGILLPRHALHENRVYLLNDQDQLEIQTIEPLLLMDNWFLASPDDLGEKQRIITSDLALPLPGTQLRGIEDKTLENARQAILTKTISTQIVNPQAEDAN